MSIITFIASLIGSGAGSSIESFIKYHGYEAVFTLMALESATLPVPSEVILPFAGLLAAKHLLNFYYVFIVSIAGSLVGMAVDYYIGYFVGKEIFYKHLNFFHIKKQSLDQFDKWFEKNAIPAVFFSRLVPVVRTVMSFPAGFAKMPKKEFFLYTGIGSAIWNVVLIAFGYYFLASNSAIEILTAIGIFAIVLYVVYLYAMKKMKQKR